MNIDKSQLADVTKSVCQEMLGISVTESAANADLDAAHFASVNISGNREAMVQIAACEGAANTISSTMFGIDQEDLEDDEVADAICEVANMIGGNFKGMLDSDCELSIPCYSNSHSSKLADDADTLVFQMSNGWIQVKTKIHDKQTGEIQ